MHNIISSYIISKYTINHIKSNQVISLSDWEWYRVKEKEKEKESQIRKETDWESERKKERKNERKKERKK